MVFYTLPVNIDETQFRFIKPDGTGDTLFSSIPSNIAAVGLNSEVANRLVFARAATVDAQYGIYRNATVSMTGATELVSPRYDFVSSLQISSNGAWVYYVGQTGNVSALYKVSINGGSPITLVPNDVLFAHVNQAGNRLVYSQLMSNNTASLFVRGVEVGDVPVQITENSGTEGFDADRPQFSKNGTRIVFSRLGTVTYDLWTMSSNGGGFQRITNTADADEFGGSFNSDGTQVSFAAVDIISSQSGIYRTSTSGVNVGRTALVLSTSVGDSTYWTSASGRARSGDLRYERLHRRR